jgi:hypothetical protein
MSLLDTMFQMVHIVSNIRNMQDNIHTAANFPTNSTKVYAIPNEFHADHPTTNVVDKILQD